MKHRIGIPVTSINDVIGVKDDLVKFTSLFGDVILLTGYDPGITALFLPGGGDVNPARYGKKPGWFTYRPDDLLEYFDTQVLPKYIGKIPVVGICRGLQTINIHYGGTLKQHLFFNKYSKDGNDLVDVVFASPPGGEHFNDFRVNSYHHQSIDKFGRGLTPIAHNTSCYEAVVNRRDKVFAVQWHPERMIRDDGYYDSWTIEHIEALLSKK